MSETMRKSFRKYLKIKAKFIMGDSNAEYKWERFKTADNGWTLASHVLAHRREYGI